MANWTRFTASRLFNAKNVFHAVLEEEDGGGEAKRVVLKKLAHDWELDKLDDKLVSSDFLCFLLSFLILLSFLALQCSLANQPRGCRPGHYIKGVVNQYRVVRDQDASRTLNIDKLKTVGMDSEVRGEFFRLLEHCCCCFFAVVNLLLLLLQPGLLLLLVLLSCLLQNYIPPSS